MEHSNRFAPLLSASNHAEDSGGPYTTVVKRANKRTNKRDCHESPRETTSLVPAAILTGRSAIASSRSTRPVLGTAKNTRIHSAISAASK